MVRSSIARGVSPPLSQNTTQHNGDAPSLSYQQVQDRLNHRFMRVMDKHEIKIDELYQLIIEMGFVINNLEAKVEQLERGA